ncbi:MAG: DUF6503 family protein [Saprospiraceae bacterium]|nr:DUF6503 family protein [Saprospiraceae bacterium]
MRSIALAGVVVCLAVFSGLSQALPVAESVIRPIGELSGEDLLARSIAYHDPSGAWPRDVHEIRLFESRPGNPPDRGGNYRITDLHIDLPGGLFRLEQQRGPDKIIREVQASACRQWLNGRETVTDGERTAFGLDCPRSLRMRDYYTYLWGLPMKLTDPGTIIDPQVYEADFFGTVLLQIRVTYDADVGGDTWYFYFHPDNYALRGYRFYHDEPANDGEYILLNGEVDVGALRLPASRKWYRHDNGTFLGEDRIIFN